MTREENRISFGPEAGEDVSPFDSLIKGLEDIRVVYARKGVVGKKFFGGTKEMDQYAQDLTLVIGAVTTAVALLETEGAEKKELLHKLRETFKTLLDATPVGTTSNQNPEEYLQMLDKHLEE